ncbi:SpvB/TcaC N-terminal domain-containing protein [Streptomyces sp. NPDC005017]|uniref:SpvB/TcaC N-terminal domain-containing protein n=1 Tax=Streptomyces sp. NPDC005017 TaxID=3364706 RepID=UPI0036AC3250
MGDAASAPDQIISLPSGGGALSGIGTTFVPDLQTGAGGLTLPIEVPAGRGGLQPRLDLVYSTGYGNGLLGQGWNLSVPGVTRKTSPVPVYRQGVDTFVLSGAEDLLPVEQLADGLRYRPRTEGLFAEIVRHGRDGGTGSSDYWEVTDKDGLISCYGTPRPDGAAVNWRDPAVTADPHDPDRIFAWSLTSTRDLLGNLVVYEYDADEGAAGAHVWRRPLLRRIRYGDYTAPDGSQRFLASVTLESEARPDAFSSYRAGFEIRTTRRYRCLRTAVHAGVDQPVRRYDFAYEQDGHNGVSLLTDVTLVGYDDMGVEQHDLPSVRFGYGLLDPDRCRLQPVTGSDPPGIAMSSADHELVDLTGDGLPDVLHLNGTARYWRNLGSGVFDRPRPMPQAPAGLALGDPEVQLLDAQGDGRADLMVTTPAVAGFFPLRFGPDWGPLSRYRTLPSTDLKDPAAQLVDLTGDGVTDAVLAGTRLLCFFSDPEAGWSGPRPARFAPDAAGQPPPSVTPGDPRVRWADMTGDGLRDLVFVHGRSVEYWPSLGHGRFGPRTRMAAVPDLPISHEPGRLLLGDLDGDGAADLVHAVDGRITVWFNRSGTSWSPPLTVPGVPEDTWDMRLTDLLGTGTSGILFSRDTVRAGTGRASMYFLDLSGGGSPRLLTEIDNQLGAVTRVAYASSAAYAASDATRPSTAWRTPLPTPVPVVARMETIDEVSGSSLTSAYRYRHGYWDGRDREFRGFGYAEQTDSFAPHHAGGPHPDHSLPLVPEASISPPTLTRTWYHLGPVDADRDVPWEELDLAHEFWPGGPPLLGHTDTIRGFLRALCLPGGAPDRAARRDALRALRGRVLRSEVYALDGTPLQDRPYTVTEHAYALREESNLRGPGGHRSFLAVETASCTTNWERGDDPQTRFSFTGDYDAHGQPRRHTQVAAPRRSVCRKPLTAAVVGAVDVDPLSVIALHTRTAYATTPTGLAPYDRVAQIRRYALANPPTVTEHAPADVCAVLSDQVRVALAVVAAFDALAPEEVTLVGHTVHHYDGPAFTGLPAGETGEHGLLTRTEELAFTDSVLDDAYRERRPKELGGTAPTPDGTPQGALSEGVLGYRRERAGAVHTEGWYADTTMQMYDVQLPDEAGLSGRGLLRAVRDPLGHETALFPDPYQLFPVRIRASAGTDHAVLETTANYNYRVGRPERVLDPNGTATTIGYQGLGLVSFVATVDRDGNGDTLERPGIRHDYDLTAYATRRQPVCARTLRRIWHATDGVSDEMIESREYSDGFARLLQTRTQADELAFGEGDTDSDSGLAGPGEAGPAVGRRRPDRVVVSGSQRYDNKGRVVETRPPVFGHGWNYTSGVGERPTVTSYDALGRPVRVVHPDGSQRRTLYGSPSDPADPAHVVPSPWTVTVYDENDLAPSSIAPDGTSLAQAAPAAHHFTPLVTVNDALGRSVCALTHGGPDAVAHHLTRTTRDVHGNVLVIADEMGRRAFEYVYDLTGRPLRVTGIDSGPRWSVPDARGSTVLTADARNALTLRTYDGLGRPRTVLARDKGGGPLTLRERVVHGDALPPGAGREKAVGARALGRIWSHDDEAGRLRIEAYDLAGRALGETRHVVSDAALAAGWEPDWAADGADDVLEPTGLLTRTRYDALGRVVETQSPGGQIVVRRYGRCGALRAMAVDGHLHVPLIAHDAQGRRVLVVYGNGLMTRYSYDSGSRRLRRLRSERALSTGDTWTGTGPPLQDLTYTYDLAGNVTRIEEHTPGCGVAGTASGRDTLTREFTYDPFYRLTSATGRGCADLATARPPEDLPRCGAVGSPYTPGPARPDQINGPEVTTAYVETYRYDETGNLRDLFYRPTTGPTVSGWHRRFGMGGLEPGDSAKPADNRLTSVRNPGGDLALGYDDAGNLITEGDSRTHRWDHAGRMTAFTEGAGAAMSVRARYLFDAAGNRVKKWVRRGPGAGHDESTVYLGALAEHHAWAVDGGGRSTVLRLHDEASQVTVIRTGDRHPDDFGPPVSYELADHLGSTALTADDTGRWATREEYFPYGETSFGGFRRKRYRFTGMPRDEETGLQPMGARSYTPGWGRWTSSDPAGPVDGCNTYAYARDNPLLFTDPTGRQSTTAGNRPQTHAVMIGNSDRSSGDGDKSTNRHASRETIARHAVTLFTKDTAEDFAGPVRSGDHVLVFIPPDTPEKLREQIEAAVRHFSERRLDARAVPGDSSQEEWLEVRPWVTYEVRTVEEDKVAEELNKAGNVRQWFYLGHGGTGAPYYDMNKATRFPPVDAFKTEIFTPDARAVFISCNSWKYAKKITEQHGIASVGSEGTTYWAVSNIKAGKLHDDAPKGSSLRWSYEPGPGGTATGTWEPLNEIFGTPFLLLVPTGSPAMPGRRR